MSFHNAGVVIVGCTLIISGLLAYKSSKSKENNAKSEEAFWGRERKANTIRRKDLTDLEYIEIPFDSLPFVLTDNYDINLCQDAIRKLADYKIVNLSAYSNTDLKLKYGVANLEMLTRYDDACANLYTQLANLAFHLSNNGYHKEAIAFSEYAISIGSDVSRTYYTLADEYIASGQGERINELIIKATGITSLMGPSIVAELNSKLISSESSV